MTVKNMEVYKRTEELLYKYYPRLINYPKSEKFSLCHSIKERFFDLLKCISLGNSVKSKRMVYLQEADGHLQTLKVLVKLSKQRKYISNGFFRDVDLELTMINKLLSGYIRSAFKK
ncbi:MAG TPA: four helix bundle protein [Pseudogracilibacillus sp.]|nr:four helix bundle protein [Pseudogracilibacillus sp.]